MSNTWHMLTGRPTPLPLTGWRQRSIEEMVAYIDRTRPLGEADLRATRVRLTRLVDSFGVPLDDSDRATIARFHRRFIEEGLSLQFNSFGRPPQYGYPDFRDLLLEVDRHGTPRSYLASEDDFQFVKRLQAEDRIVPIVGDLSGATALAAVAKFLSRANLQVAAFYILECGVLPLPRRPVCGLHREHPASAAAARQCDRSQRIYRGRRWRRTSCGLQQCLADAAGRHAGRRIREGALS